MEALSFLDPLKMLPGVNVDFVERIAGIEVDDDKDEVLQRLAPSHKERIHQLSGHSDCWYGEQVHGIEVAKVEGGTAEELEGVDGLITRNPGVVLGIHVADCGAIWLADRRTGGIGLLHSGKKGTEGNILEQGLKRMSESFGTHPRDVVAVLGPCIRPPQYEVDFARMIGRQASALGINEFHDSGLNTAVDLKRYYSYRMEKGKTGRMLALIVRREAQ